MDQPNIVSINPDYLIGLDGGHPVRVPVNGPDGQRANIGLSQTQIAAGATGVVGVTASGQLVPRSAAGDFYMPAPSGADDTAALNAVLAAAPAGSAIHWHPSGTYLISGVAGLTSTVAHKHVGNRARITRATAEYASLPTTSMYMLSVKNESNTSTFTAVPVVAGQTTFDVPSGEPLPAVGDLVRFRSGDTRVTSGTYLYGHETWVQGLSGRTITLAEEFPEAMGVIVLVYNSGVSGLELDGLTFDLSNVPSIGAGTTFQPDHAGLYAHSRGVLISNCEFIGSNYTTSGGVIRGSAVRVTNSKFYWMYCQNGLYGGGRTGYGLEIQASNALVECSEFIGCKHSIAFGSDRTLVTRGATFRRNRVIEPSYQPNATDTTNGFTGATDAHANLLGPFVVEDNDIDCVLYAANFRNGSGVFANNRVRQVLNSATFSALNWYEMPMARLDCYGNRFWFSSNGKILGTPYDLTQSHTGIRIVGNVVDGGAVLNTSPTTASLELVCDDNIHTNVAANSIRINSGSNSATEVRAKIRNNKITGILATTGVGIRLEGGSTNQRASKFVNCEIARNEIDYSLSTASVYGIELTNATFTGCSIEGNRVQRNPVGSTSNIRGIGIRTADTTGLRIVGNETLDAWILFESSGAASSNHTDTFIGGGNKIRQLQFTESAASSPMPLIGVLIQGNEFRRTDNAESIGYSPQASSTGIGAGRVLVSGNSIMGGNGSSGNCVNITANAVGHKFEFLDNTMLRPVLDSSGTYYGVWRNTLLNSTQTWRDSTTAQYDGRLLKSAAPTGGTWALGDRVYHSAPATAAPDGWVCSAAGTPGTWKAMANLT
jgi:uncharacterized protein YjbI with pentapeptide repeats